MRTLLTKTRTALAARAARRAAEDRLLAVTHDVHERELRAVPLRTHPVYAATVAATGTAPSRTVLPGLSGLLAHLDALAEPLRARVVTR